MAAVSEKSNAAAEQGNTKSLRGRVGAVGQGGIFGLAFGSAAPTQRPPIRVNGAGSGIAEAVAARNRPDLKRNGIGDG
ncbi:hypothetical protein BSZ18_00225, partial [Bradyrhizobium canariense]